MNYFDVPEWLAEEKFEYCDEDHDQIIRLVEIQCFWIIFMYNNNKPLSFIISISSIDIF